MNEELEWCQVVEKVLKEGIMFFSFLFSLHCWISRCSLPRVLMWSEGQSQCGGVILAFISRLRFFILKANESYIMLLMELRDERNLDLWGVLEID